MSKSMILIALVCGYFGWKQHGHRLFPGQKISKEVVSCEAKAKCLVVYVAPWCSACHQMTPAILELQARSKTNEDIGVKVIVGAGRSPDENKEMAQQFGAGTLQDDDKSIHNTLKVAYYPSIFLVNEKQEIIQRDQDALSATVAILTAKD